MNRIIKIIPVLLGFIFSQMPFQEGEKLVYSAGFRLFAAGTATMEIVSDSLGGSSVYRIISRTRTGGLLDRFYRVRDEIDVWLDKGDFNLLRMNKKIREGSHKKNFHAIIDTSNNTATMGDKTLELPDHVLDPMSAIYFLRMQDLSLGKNYSFNSFDNGKLKNVLVSVKKEETISVPAGIFKCILVTPSSGDGSALLKNNGQMKIWFSADNQKIPVKIEQNTNIGTMILELKKVVIPLIEEAADVIEHDDNK
ncbi:MAG: DUF3108 domain-containing protein [Candidatus Marinimicrobia bacterium]|mgnify:FL=1|jgi:hypothetical protein|nr:DUF3108 domain-containing protein [Candidatus Neomarinimicrobiota bacterium]MBT3633921.1 DUF3108 domain-containing protein [Candidatus Neomarinimicrobiota bacterium]MBT3682830.1 DUF3108 domain-containing protein [Candidatus Neomarinimicrobiota bacterium]MBT3759983.1 DUF3108 domain-containing protein [Candidatus Neomarinimicrobiota bacterium]MBT3896077.1 DUF3108 domain-containing protein [Candidatus Neomarinimicrobiota bacterium]